MPTYKFTNDLFTERWGVCLETLPCLKRGYVESTLGEDYANHFFILELDTLGIHIRGN